MIWHGNKRFTAQAQPLFFHCGGNHFVSFTRANHMGQQGVVAVQDVGNGIALVGPQCDFRVHTEKLDVAAVVLTGADAVELSVVQAYQCLPTLLAVFVIDCIVNFGGPQVECVLQQMIAVDTFCAVSVRDADIIVALALVGNIPVIQVFIVTDSYFLFAVG